MFSFFSYPRAKARGYLILIFTLPPFKRDQSELFYFGKISRYLKLIRAVALFIIFYSTLLQIADCAASR